MLSSELFSFLKIKIHFLFSEFSYLLTFYFPSSLSLQISSHGKHGGTCLHQAHHYIGDLTLTRVRTELVTTKSFSESHSEGDSVCMRVGELGEPEERNDQPST